MIVVSSQQMAALERGASHWQLQRHDAWLRTSLQGWADRADQIRLAQLTAATHFAQTGGLVQENDARLFCWLYLALAAQAEVYFSRSDIREVLAWDVVNRGAILHEIYQRAGADIRPVVAML